MYRQSRKPGVKKKPADKTSWQQVGKWYGELTQGKGHYFHEHVIMPNLMRLLKLSKTDSVLDLASGSGVLGRTIPKNVPYLGIDAAEYLVAEARRSDESKHHEYIFGDITRSLENLVSNALLQSEALKVLKSTFVPKPKGTKPDNPNPDGRKGAVYTFNHVACVLALQNVENFKGVFENAFAFLKDRGELIIVINHPSYRIPRQSSWGIDENSKLQYRRVNRYMSALKIPVTMNPGQGEKSPFTWTFHYPLSTYINGLTETGFVVTRMEEWTSDKESEGKSKNMENRARAEIPLFMAIVAKKNTSQ